MVNSLLDATMHGPSPDAEVPGRNTRPVVHAEDGVHREALEQAVLHHLAGAAAAFFRQFGRPGRPCRRDEAIKLPLNMDAATAASISTSMDYTAAIMFFDYLPDVAEI